jgi:hypothetical protein
MTDPTDRQGSSAMCGSSSAGVKTHYCAALDKRLPRPHSPPAAPPDLCAAPANWLHSLTCSPTGPLRASPPTDYPAINPPVAGRPRHFPPDLLASCHTDSAQHRKPFNPKPQCSSHSSRATSTASTYYIPVAPSASSPKPSSRQGGDVGTPTNVCHTLQVALPPDRTVSCYQVTALVFVRLCCTVWDMLPF